MQYNMLIWYFLVLFCFSFNYRCPFSSTIPTGTQLVFRYNDTWEGELQLPLGIFRQLVPRNPTDTKIHRAQVPYGFPSGKDSACQKQETQEMWVQSIGQEDLLEKEMATHSSNLAWEIPCTEGAWWATVCGVAKNLTRLQHC